MPDNGGPRINMLPLQPMDFSVTVGTAEAPEKAFVQVSFATYLGLQSYFIPVEQAENIAEQIIGAARHLMKKPRLIVPKVDVSKLDGLAGKE